MNYTREALEFLSNLLRAEGLKSYVDNDALFLHFYWGENSYEVTFEDRLKSYTLYRLYGCKGGLSDVLFIANTYGMETLSQTAMKMVYYITEKVMV